MKRGLLLALALVTFAPTAVADTPPTVWDVARDPAERARWELHVRVQRLLSAPIPDDSRAPESRRDTELRFEAARAMLEDGGAANSPDVRLRFDLGIVYAELARLYERNDLYRRVIEVLVPAIEAAPDHPASTDALDALISAYSKLDRPQEEMIAWQRLLGRLDDDRWRATPLMNMGETEMRLGRLDEAIGTFRNVLEICGTLPNSTSRNVTYALALWDLAVALDRAGDPSGAIDRAAKAMHMQWDEAAPLGQTHTVSGWDAIHDEETVYFVPSWERDWYFAIGYAAAAREERDPRAAASLWAQSESHWDTYVDRASSSPKQDRWLAIARVRREHAHRERVAADGRAAKAPPGPKKDESPHGEERL